MKSIMQLLSFVAITNAAMVTSLYLVQLIVGWGIASFFSDYFFYAFIIQIGLGALFSASPPSRLRYLKHSTSRATKAAASMTTYSEAGEDNHFSSAELGLGMKFLLSGITSLLICVFI